MEQINQQIRARLIPAKSGETHEVGDRLYPVLKYYDFGDGYAIPLLDIPMASDYQWQVNALQSRIEHPERYEECEDVAETIGYLKNWLTDYAQKAAQNTKEEHTTNDNNRHPPAVPGC